MFGQFLNRTRRSRSRKSSCRLQLEGLEARELLSTTSPSGGFTAAQIQRAYGIPGIALPAGQLPGTGQTIAIYEGGTDSKFVNSTDPHFATSDLAVFDQAMGLPNPPSFTVIAYDPETHSVVPDRTTLTAIGSHEYALDVEWAHTAAPGANIIVVEQLVTSGLTSDQSTTDHAKTLQFAASLPGVSVISNSFGINESALTDPTSLDAYLVSPSQTFNPATGQTTPGHGGVTFVAASGDEKGPKGSGTNVWAPRWPSVSPNVVAVGGTALNLDANNNYLSETAWDYSQGGPSASESKPAYQDGVNPTTQRLVPDVAALSDGQNDTAGGATVTGVDVYDSLNPPPGGPWVTTGGTSLAAPLWAGFISIANQLRAADGLPPLDGVSQTHPRLYQLPHSDFHAITSVFDPAMQSTQDPNGLAANDPRASGAANLNPNYNEYTGLGSPIANLLIPDLAGTRLAYGVVPVAAAVDRLAVTPLVTFTDENLFSQPGQFSATVFWGDGTVSSGTVVGAAPHYTVLGTHTYTHAGVYTVSVSLTGDGSGTTLTTTAQALVYLPDGSRGTPKQRFVAQVYFDLTQSPIPNHKLKKLLATLKKNRQPFLANLLATPSVQRLNRANEISVVYAYTFFRPPAADVVAQGVHFLAHGGTLARLVQRFMGGSLTTAEYMVARALTVQFLGRQPTPAELFKDARLLQRGEDDKLIAQLAASLEYYLATSL